MKFVEGRFHGVKAAGSRRGISGQEASRCTAGYSKYIVAVLEESKPKN